MPFNISSSIPEEKRSEVNECCGGEESVMVRFQNEC